MEGKQDFWAGHMDVWQASGYTQARYCREHQLALASFGYWRRKLKGPKPSPTRGLLPIVGPTAGERSRIEIALGNGVTLRVPLAVQPAQVVAWVRALGVC